MPDQLAVICNQMEVSRLLIRYGIASLAPESLVGPHCLDIQADVANMFLKHIAICTTPPGRLISVQRDWLRFLIENTELFWIKEDPRPWDRGVHTFVYGAIEESTAAFFLEQDSRPIAGRTSEPDRHVHRGS